jgi:hypothetical protein
MICSGWTLGPGLKTMIKKIKDKNWHENQIKLNNEG